MPGDLRVITWNVARRRSVLEDQAAAIAGRRPDVVLLQEITRNSAASWRAALARAGLPHVVETIASADPHRAPPGPRRTGVLVAARSPLEPFDAGWELPWPEVLACARAPDGLELHAVHVPQAANGVIKPLTLARLHAGLARAPGAPRVLGGDLNTPRRETPEGDVLTFAQDSAGRLRAARGEPWDAAERAMVTGLGPTGLRDVYRSHLGYGVRDRSWVYPRGGGGYRIDHLLASGHFEVLAVRYRHDWRDDGLSDHSAMEADLRWRATAAVPRGDAPPPGRG